MKVVCISGKAQHGKDTTASMIQECLEQHNKRVVIVHYADLLKYICKTFFGWDGNKDEKGRKILQYVGTDIIRKKVPNYWVDFVSEFLEIFDNEWDWVLIPDTRFPNEVDLMREKFDATHIRVVRPDFVSPLTAEQQNHPSEIALDEEIPDCYIMNVGDLNDLRETVNTWIKETIYAE